MERMYPEDLILVAIIPTPRDLEIARVLGWYRIPLQTAPKTVLVDWIAFYQPASFGKERWSIRSIARIMGVELVTRSEILQEEWDHPRAKEPYYKVQLGPLQWLENPIRAERWRRISFLYTVGKRFMHVRTVEELRIRSSIERDLLWRLLKDSGSAEEN